MKKLLLLLLVTVLCLTALIACDKDNGDNNNNDDTPAIEWDVEAAKDFVKSFYENDPVVTASDYEVIPQTIIGNATYTITWTVDTDKVTVDTVDGKVIINVDEKSKEEVVYVLTATITAGDGTTAQVKFNHKVPVYNVLSFEEYMAAKKDETVVIEGIVVAMNAKSLGNSRNHIFLADANVTGGYYSYQMDADPVKDLGIEIGMTVSVTGPIAPYYGMQEIKGGVATIVDRTIKTVAPVDITTAFQNGDSLKNYVGLPVTIKGVTIDRQALTKDTDQYLYFKLGEKESYLRTYITDFPTTLTITVAEDGSVSSADKTTIDEAHAAKFGWTANVTGILVLYSESPYLIPMTTDCFEYLEYVEKTAEEKVDYTLENLTVNTTITADGTVTLPLVGANYADVVLSWAVDSTDYTINENGEISFTLGDSEKTIVLTVTATCGEVNKTKEFTVTISANVVLNANHAYVGSVNQVKVNKVLYLNGEVSDRYLATTTNPDEAVAVYAEAVTGGYKFYILGDDGTKQYITIYTNDANKTAVKYDAAGETVFSYNKSVNGWITNFNGTDSYLGMYSEYETVSVSSASYLKPDTTGVSQFPLEILPVADGASFNMSINQVKNNKVLYLNGQVSGRYLATTTDVAAAVTVYAEAVEGGYKFYILVEDAKQYITIYNNEESKLSVKYDAAGTTVFNYDGSVNGWFGTFNDALYWIGTYSTYETASASGASYLKPDNTGISQFPLEIAGAVVTGGDEGGETTGAITVIADALAAADGAEVVLTGTVISAETWNTEYNNMTVVISDGTSEIKAFRLKTLVSLGDVITVTGTMTTYSKTGEREIAEGCTAVIVDYAPVKVTIPEALELADGRKVIVAGTVTEVSEWSTQWNNMNVTISDGTNTLYIYRLATQVKVGDYIIVTGAMGTYDGDRQIAEGATAVIEDKPAAVVAGGTIVFESANRTEWDENHQLWAQNSVTVTNEKGASTSNVADFVAPARFYKNSTLTIAYNGMLKLVVNCNSSSYATAFKSSVDAANIAGVTATVDGNAVVIEFAEATDSITIVLSGGQVRVDSMETYVAATTSGDVNTETGDTPTVEEETENA